MKGDDEDTAAPLARHFLWVDRPAGVERLVRALYVLCALLVVFGLFWHRHAYVPGEEMKGYHAIVGFFAFMWIVLGARGLRRLIRRGEDYYGPTSVNSERYPERGLERLDARDGDEAERLLAVRDGRVIDGDRATHTSRARDASPRSASAAEADATERGPTHGGAADRRGSDS